MFLVGQVEAINRLFISFWNSKGTQRLLSLSPSSTINSSFQPKLPVERLLQSPNSLIGLETAGAAFPSLVV